MCEPAAVSIDVPIEELPAVVAERGPDAYLVSVRDTRPHVVAVTVAWRDGDLVVGAGRRTGRNVADRPLVTLLWPVTDHHPKHSLLVDGTARTSEDGEWLHVTPTSAILHRAGGRRRRLDDGDAGDPSGDGPAEEAPGPAPDRT